MKKYKALIFDWDGTLADSTLHIVHSVQYAFRNNNLDVPSDELSRSIIGLSLEQGLKKLSQQNIGYEQLIKLVQDYRAFYFGQDKPICFFENTKELLKHWQIQYILGIATGKSRRGLERGLDDTQSRSFFSATRTADECASKPNPEMILSLCYEWGLSPSEVIMIGDTTHDLLTAQNAGADAAAVATGAHSKQDLMSVASVGIFDNLMQFSHWLDEI